MAEVSTDLDKERMAEVSTDLDKERMAEASTDLDEVRMAEASTDLDEVRMAEASIRGDEVGGHSHTVLQASDQLIDPWCEICFAELKRKIRATAQCVECNILYCTACLENHNKFPDLQNHRILRGDKMPKSQADKPVRYPNCNIHLAELNNHYCLEHNEMICTGCMKQDHKTCNAWSISDICKKLGTEDIHKFKKEVMGMQQNAEKIKSVLEQNISDIKIKEDDLIKAAKDERDRVIAKADELFTETVSKVRKMCQTENSRITNKVTTLADEIHSLGQIIENIDKKADFSFDQNIFIQVQHIVAKVHEHQKEIEEMTRQWQQVSLSFASSKDISRFLTECKELGNVKVVLIPLDVKAIPDIVFPQSFRQQIDTRRRTRDLLQIRAAKMSPVHVKAPDDKGTCDITDLDIARHSTVVLVDRSNVSLKLMSRDTKIISYYPLDSCPMSVRVIDNTTAIVGTVDKELHIFDISNQENITLDRTIPLEYYVSGIHICCDNLVVTCWGKSNCVKLIDLNGKELWSVSVDKQQQELFHKPRSIACNTLHGTTQVIVTDWGKDTITLLHPDNGSVIKKIDVTGKGPHGLTVDKDGNVYVCCRRVTEICVFTPDLEQRKVILTGEDLQAGPLNIVYDGSSNAIYISYGRNATNNTIDCFKLS